ncbi:MAG: hypothetical protein DI630_21430 [Gordonia sp. (in: high G+C Gram-positive bacteria)]|nr:MAG: hypothetical protein DI630_21430 [Gordonia sp. (in: high G+C Gram-positive bacteria)]
MIPDAAPTRKFVRYVRAVEKSKQLLFPITPSTRPLHVAIDVDALGSDPQEYGQLLEDLRRQEVEDFLLTGPGQSPPGKWLFACRTDRYHSHSFAGLENATRMADSVEFWVDTNIDGQNVGSSRCHFFDVYPRLDASVSPADNLSHEDRIRAAVLAAANYALGVDVMVSTSPTVGRADVADNDIVATVSPHDLRPVFGHYLRMTGNTTISEHRTSHSVHTTRGSSITDIYGSGVRSLLPYTEMLQLVAMQLGKNTAVAELDSIITRIRRAARALDEVLAGLSRTNGHREHPDTDTTEFVSEAFDRELLYLIAALDTYGRAFHRWLDPNRKSQRVSLHSARTLVDHVDPNYPNAPRLQELHDLQKFAYTAAQLRNQLHANVLRTGATLSRAYGSAQAVVIHLDELTGVELDQRQVDTLGVWAAETNTPFDPTRPTVADLATTAYRLFTTLTQYIDGFSRLIMCTRPAAAPNADELLGKVTEDFVSDGPPPATGTELLYRQLTGWTSST